jgi:hypothetical protein
MNWCHTPCLGKAVTYVYKLRTNSVFHSAKLCK